MCPKARSGSRRPPASKARRQKNVFVPAAGDAPKVFGRISSNGVPVNALLLSAVGIGIASIVYTINPASAFPIMIALSMFGALFTWGSIFVTHMFFRKHIIRSKG